jgi:putative heme transporter
MDLEQHPQKQSKWKIILTVLAFVALITLIIGLRKQIGEVISDLGKVNTLALLFIIPLRFLNFDSYSRFYMALFIIFGERVKYWPMYKLALELNFMNYILPSGGVSGISYFGVRMKALGVSAAKATLVQFFKFILLYLSFLPLLIAGTFLLALNGKVNNLILMIASSIITLVIVGSFIGVYIIDSRSRINSFLTFLTKLINRIVHIVRPKYPETIRIENAQRVFNELHDNYQVIKTDFNQLKKPFIFMTIANITEIATLYTVYIAFGELVNLGAVILAFAIANFAGLVSVLPAGIGIYEGLMTAVLLTCGVPPKLSIPVTIMYRVITMVIQLTPGYILYQQAVKNGLSKKI